MFREKTSQGRAKYEIATFDATENIFNDATDGRTDGRGRTGGSMWMEEGCRLANDADCSAGAGMP